MGCRIFYLGLLGLWGSFALAQAPSGLTVTSATNKQVVLSWSGAAASYSVQRAQLGGGYTTIATANSATYTDTSIDAYTTYQYQILNGGSSSNAVTVGPPPSGVTNAAAAPIVGASPSTSYGFNIALTLDGNGDPAFAFLWDDPNNDTDHSDTQLLFRSWNRAQYKWNAVVKIATVGDVATGFRSSTSLAYDSSTGAFAAASEVNQGANVDAGLYVSADGGATWTVKNTFHGNGTDLVGPSVALAHGNVYLAYTLNPAGLAYVTGQLNQSANTWTTKQVPAFQKLTPDWSTAPSIALDSAGNPGIAYLALDPNDGNDGPLLFWRPNTGTVVKITDSQENGTGQAVKLLYHNLNPRVVMYLLRNDSNSIGDDGVHFARSDDGGVTWQTPVLIPPDGTSSTDFPFDMALDSKGDVAVAFGQNGGTGDAKCGNPKISLSSDLVHFTTCSYAPVNVSGNFGPYPSGLQVAYGGNDKLYVLWLEASGDQANTGVLMYREPPANAISGPSITSVLDNNTTRATIVGGSWISIFGTNLSGTTRIWGGNDFNNGNQLPTSLDGVSVKVNGVPAAVYYISPTQINVQAPSPLTGSAGVQVTYHGAASNTFSVNAVANAPSLFSYSIGGTTYPSALFANSSVIVGDPAQAGSIVAKPHAGDYIQLYANALGSSPAGTIVNSVIPFSNSLTVTIGSANAPVQFAGLVAAGEYQINVMVPSLAPGIYPVVVTAAGQSSQTGVMIPVQ